ncbi:putative TIM-barrel fold metal-dependent hydrolase [Rhodoligotrophos appendicifer]|uniref:amidohydrolase family protein n=1 Tax=Rhodoligotrophos appendicifer TaxID=987056 RepID=UPI001184D48A|nr:amidohydrolase family protein [Rhodoligotrophos appendicifer]
MNDVGISDDRDVWLKQVVEEAIERDLPIVDPHFHFFTGRGHDYLAANFLAELDQGHRVVGAIHVEANADFFAHGGAEGEMRFAAEQSAELLALQRGRAWRTAIGVVGYADLRKANLEEELDSLVEASQGSLKGIRNSSAWDPDPSVKNGHTSPPAGLLCDPAFRRGLRGIAARNLTFDSYCFFPQLPEVVKLARAVPEAKIVCDHMGGIIGIGPYKGRHDEFFDEWARNLAELSKCSNVFLKLGGMAMSVSGFGWHKRTRPLSSDEYAAHYQRWFDTAIDLFGCERCMFESNFPVDGVSISYGILWNAFKKIATRYSPAEKSALFRDTAINAYRLELNG